MEDLSSVVDWSRAQFALTAIYHWIFVPLTIGLSVIVGVMETIYYRKRTLRWLNITKFWMTLFGINFAIGVATGIVLEFEFGTNWSNYSWFVGDIFGAPLAVEGILAFFMEATFIAVMFFGWKKVSRGFHLAATWLTALGTSLSALWILVANAWMQYPVGCSFDPDNMRNVMDSFWTMVLSPMALNKFFHTIMSGWTLGAVFVVGVSSWLLFRKRNVALAVSSLKVASVVGVIGIIATSILGDTSAKVVAATQPMKLAAMEGLYDGNRAQEIVGVGVLTPGKLPGDDKEPFLFDISVPYGLSILATGDPNAFVPGINDIIAGRTITESGDTLYADSYAERIERGKAAHQALRDYDAARKASDTAAMAAARQRIDADFHYFGYGYFERPADAVPNVPITFYAFHTMVYIGGWLLIFLCGVAFLIFKKPHIVERNRWLQWAAIASVPLVWLCSECGWVVAEVGRQPWIIQDLMPVSAAISSTSAGGVMLTFTLFAVVFTGLFIAEVSIMLRYISRKSKTDIENQPE